VQVKASYFALPCSGSPLLHATFASQSQPGEEKIWHIEFSLGTAAKNTDFQQQISKL
jgi:hypothetical protein